jgi:hypothetical protein
VQLSNHRLIISFAMGLTGPDRVRRFWASSQIAVIIRQRPQQNVCPKSNHMTQYHYMIWKHGNSRNKTVVGAHARQLNSNHMTQHHHMIWKHGNGRNRNWPQQNVKHFPTIWPQKIGIKPRSLTLDGKLCFEAKKMLTCMITKGNYFLSICKVKN